MTALNNCLLSAGKLPIILCGDFNLPNIDWSVVFPTISTPVNNEFCAKIHIRDNSGNLIVVVMLVTCLYTGVTTIKQLTMRPVIIDIVK